MTSKHVNNILRTFFAIGIRPPSSVARVSGRDNWKTKVRILAAMNVSVKILIFQPFILTFYTQCGDQQ